MTTPIRGSRVRSMVVAMAVVAFGLVAAPAQANDFFSTLFGGMMGQPSPSPWRRRRDKAAQRPATSSVPPATRRYSTALISIMRRRRTAKAIRHCRTPSVIATRSFPAVPATARIRSAWQRSTSRTIRPCARVISSPVRTGCWWRISQTSAAHR